MKKSSQPLCLSVAQGVPEDDNDWFADKCHAKREHHHPLER